MDLSKLRNITNNYRDVRLISLRKWKRASEFEPCDQGGPYVIAQEGFDPQDLQMRPADFVLGKSGSWVRLAIFYGLPEETRLQEFVFRTAAEVMGLLENLSSEVRMIRSGREFADAEAEHADDLNEAVAKGRNEVQPTGDPYHPR